VDDSLRELYERGKELFKKGFGVELEVVPIDI
jgi:hypothetical protein